MQLPVSLPCNSDHGVRALQVAKAGLAIINGTYMYQKMSDDEISRPIFISSNYKYKVIYNLEQCCWSISTTCIGNFQVYVSEKGDSFTPPPGLWSVRSDYELEGNELRPPLVGLICGTVIRVSGPWMFESRGSHLDGLYWEIGKHNDQPLYKKFGACLTSRHEAPSIYHNNI